MTAKVCKSCQREGVPVHARGFCNRCYQRHWKEESFQKQQAFRQEREAVYQEHKRQDTRTFIASYNGAEKALMSLCEKARSKKQRKFFEDMLSLCTARQEALMKQIAEEAIR
jgi:hypothetical protein